MKFINKNRIIDLMIQLLEFAKELLAFSVDFNILARNIEREGLSLCGLKVIGCNKSVPRTPQF